ncbi:MAG: long-chain-fatty-acid--CoA ligase [Pseudomonadota bacterium]
MLGQMMDRPLLLPQIMEHAARNYRDQEIVSLTPEGAIHRYTYVDALKRIKQLSNVLTRMGIKKGDRVATIAWNTHRHFEIYYATAAIGAVCHTINPLLGPEQVAYVANHAEDKAMFFDTTFAPLVAPIADYIPSIETYVAMTDDAHLPEFSKPGLAAYETLMAAESQEFEFPEFDERTACGLCYTSGTTGNPKGVLFSHRSNYLHALTANQSNVMGTGEDGVLLAVVPMFHVNAWGVPYSIPMSGGKLVFPGPRLDGEGLYNIIEQEQCTASLGVPTIWLGLINYMKENNKKFSSLQYSCVGGSAMSEYILRTFQEDYGVEMYQGWGMTEMSPLGTVNRRSRNFDQLSEDEQIAVQLKQGRAVSGVDMRIVGADGAVLPNDGMSSGHLQVRGPWIISEYYKYDGETLTADGWFDTGDVATIDEDGYMHITDRAKDVIKSGGEWVSSIDIENAALSHPGVARAGVIGVYHEKWQERPLLVVVREPGTEATEAEIIDFLKGRLAKIALPNAVEFIDEMPLGATGKILKTKLREMFKDYRLSA